ncbi:MAG: CpaD family pilus assembly protein [Hyphomicrobiales bacterium]|nr:CpaD family pilus assembly protein [Hyphomicrobiales bacterium]
MSIASGGVRAGFSSTKARAARRLALLLGATSLLAGCGVNRMAEAPTNTVDVRARHPIALVQRQRSVDLFPTQDRDGLDSRTRSQIADFADRYTRTGHGPVSVIMPQSGPGAASAAASLEGIRRELAHDGVRASVLVSHYPVVDPSLAAPVRIAFDALEAKVAHRCGEWPSDLGSGSDVSEWSNRPYYNLGCANQNMLAAQVDDPRDLAGPRGESPADVMMRMRAIKKVRDGADPATQWSTKAASIGGLGN